MTFIAVVSTVILKVALVGQRDTGPRLLAAELRIQVADGSGWHGERGHTLTRNS